MILPERRASFVMKRSTRALAAQASCKDRLRRMSGLIAIVAQSSDILIREFISPKCSPGAAKGKQGIVLRGSVLVCSLSLSLGSICLRVAAVWFDAARFWSFSHTSF